MVKIFLSAGEVSGDLHGAFLAKKLKELIPDLYLYGLGGERMRSAGVEIYDDLTAKNSVGILESLPFLFSNLKALKKTVALLKKERPDVVVFIDNQGFNLQLAKTTKKLGIYSFYYFAPQLWLWGKKKKEDIVKHLDHILATFRNEYDFYKDSGINIDYIGHPLLEEIGDISFSELNKDKKEIALLPGSREQEFKVLLPLFIETAKRLKDKYKFLMPFASDYFFKKYGKDVPDFIEVSVKNGHEVMRRADLLLLSSGTATLEGAIFEKPMIITYRISSLSAWIVKKVVKISHVGMPNILAEKEIVPELLQENLNLENIIENIDAILEDEKRYNSIKKELKKVKEILKPYGAVTKAAKLIETRCENGKS